MDKLAVKRGDAFAFEIYFQQLARLAEDVRHGAEEMNRGLKATDERDRFWFALQATINTMATMALFLWPTPKRSGGFNKRRAAALRACLGYSETGPSALLNVRNSIAHMDERIDDFYSVDRTHPYLDRLFLSSNTTNLGLDESVSAADTTRTHKRWSCSAMNWLFSTPCGNPWRSGRPRPRRPRYAVRWNTGPSAQKRLGVTAVGKLARRIQSPARVHRNNHVA